MADYAVVASVDLDSIGPGAQGLQHFPGPVVAPRGVRARMTDNREQVAGAPQCLFQGKLVKRSHTGADKNDVFPRAVLEAFEKNQVIIS